MVCVMKSQQTVTKAAQKYMLALYAVFVIPLDIHHMQIPSVAVRVAAYLYLLISLSTSARAVRAVATLGLSAP